MALFGSRGEGERFKRTTCLWCKELVSGPQLWFDHREKIQLGDFLCPRWPVSQHHNRTSLNEGNAHKCPLSIYNVLTRSRWNIVSFTTTSSSTATAGGEKNKKNDSFQLQFPGLIITLSILLVFHFSAPPLHGNWSIRDPLFPHPLIADMEDINSHWRRQSVNLQARCISPITYNASGGSSSIKINPKKVRLTPTDSLIVNQFLRACRWGTRLCDPHTCYISLASATGVL